MKRALLGCGLLMALGWAINGMIGSASGAAIPGAFIGMAVAVILGLDREGDHGTAQACRSVMRIGAFGAIGFWFGGEMTYGQMFGLMKPGVDGAAHYDWGLLGTAVKGSAWHGVGAACIGLGLMCRRYRWWELAALMAVMTGASCLGIALLNQPLDSPDALPLIRFSYDPADPDAPGRSEHWAGLWAGLIVLLAYAAIVKHDRVTLRFGLFGILGGGLGFAVGQVLQAWSWAHPALACRPWIDWWKVMELTFGLIGGLAIAVAAIRTPRDAVEPQPCDAGSSAAAVEWAGIVLWFLIAGGYYWRHPVGNVLAVPPFVPGVVVLSGLTFGRWWPWVIVGLHVPLSTSLVTATEVLRAYPEDTGWTTNDGRVVSLLEVMGAAWPMLVVGLLLCIVPIALLARRRSPWRQSARWILQVFVGYHVLAVVVQMVWMTLRWAPSRAASDLLAFARPYVVLTVVYLVCWEVAMAWLRGWHRPDAAPRSGSGLQTERPRA